MYKNAKGDTAKLILYRRLSFVIIGIQGKYSLDLLTALI